MWGFFSNGLIAFWVNIHLLPSCYPLRITAPWPCKTGPLVMVRTEKLPNVRREWQDPTAAEVCSFSATFIQRTWIEWAWLSFLPPNSVWGGLSASNSSITVETRSRDDYMHCSFPICPWWTCFSLSWEKSQQRWFWPQGFHQELLPRAAALQMQHTTLLIKHPSS